MSWGHPAASHPPLFSHSLTLTEVDDVSTKRSKREKTYWLAAVRIVCEHTKQTINKKQCKRVANRSYNMSDSFNIRVCSLRLADRLAAHWARPPTYSWPRAWRAAGPQPASPQRTAQTPTFVNTDVDEDFVEHFRRHFLGLFRGEVGPRGFFRGRFGGVLVGV